MKKQTRREFLKHSALATGGVLLSNLFSPSMALSASDLKIQEHTRKPLPFDPKKLIGISEKMILSHWENNYGGSVKILNSVNRKLATALNEAENQPFAYGDLKRQQLLRTGSVILHELYFENLGSKGGPETALKTELTSQFGSFETWLAEFKKIAQSLSGGSGWVVLAFNTHFRKMENHGLSDHLQHPPASIPLLVLDMFEHSYQMDYGAAAAKYIDAFFSNVNWSVVQKRLERLKSL
jgi:superoxide dismutase, Fe-Mn family